MMKTKKIARKAINDKVEQLISDCKSTATATKLRQVSKVCEDLVEHGITPTIVLVVKYLKQEAIQIKKQTIYNKREGGNPYREIIDAWIDYATAKFNEKKISIPKAGTGNSVLEDEDLAMISDPVIRYRVSLLMGEMKGLRNQLNMARELKNLPPIHSAPTLQEIGHEESSNIILNSYEIEVLTEFSNGSANVGFDEDGALAAKRSIRRDSMLSSPGLQQALQKILKSYSRPQIKK